MTKAASPPLSVSPGAQPAAVAAPASAESLPPRKHAHYSLFVITVVVMFTVLDRTILSLLIEPIKQDFGISDTQAALLIGAAFSLPYGIAGIAVGRLADHMNRRNIIAASCAFWSVATMACGLAQGFVSLLIARMGIGAGESGYGPAAWSIATDYWPREKVAFATSVMGVGAQAGMGLAFLFGGAVLFFVQGLPPLEVPAIGVIRPWQWAFILVGAPGVLWALVVLTTREPPRRGLALGQKAVKVPVAETYRWVRDDWRVYLATVGGMAIKAMLIAGPAAWGPTFVYREYGWELSQIGMVSGTITLIVSPLGLLAGAKLSEIWVRSGRQDANLRIVFYSLLVTLPLNVLAYMMPTAWGYYAVHAVSGFISMLAFGPGIAAFQLVTPNRMRGQLGALVQFCNNVLAFALSPLIVALFTDYLFGNEADLQWSIVLNTVIMGGIAAVVIGQGLKPYARSYERATREFTD
jgi:MFS family permease